jgi:hypothetical protein
MTPIGGDSVKIVGKLEEMAGLTGPARPSASAQPRVDLPG